MKILIINEHVEDKLGGSELQCDIIARKLTEFGHEVTYLAVRSKKNEYEASYRTIPVSEVDTVSFYEGVKQIDPDVIFWRYYKRQFLQTSKKIKQMGYPIVFSVSHEVDTLKYRWGLLKPRLDTKSYLYNGYRFLKNIYEFNGFRNVDVVVNQCRTFMGRVPSVEVYFPNSMHEEKTEFAWSKRYCVWVSNLKKRKNPTEYIKLAERFSDLDLDFLIVGEIQDSKYNFVNNADELPPNVQYIGPKSISETNGIIEKSMFLIHTCDPEGFPNTFIQSWYFGKPVVSLNYDPDGLIEQKKIGFYSKTHDQFIKDVRKLITDEKLRNQMGYKAMKFANANFNSRKNIKKLEDIFRKVLSETRH